MKMKLLTLSLVAVLAACNKTPANNVAAANQAAPAADGNSAGLPTPPERSAAAGESAMPPGLDCVRDRLSPDERRAAAQLAMEQGSRDDPRAQTVLQAVEACGDQLSWSQQKRRLAGMFSLSAAGAAGIRQEMNGQGVPIEELDRTIISDSQLMAAAEAGQMGGSVGQDFAMRHIDEIQRIAGGRPLEGQLGMRIGNYIAFRALAETLAGQFGREN